MNHVLDFISLLERALGMGASVSLRKAFDDLLIRVDWPDGVHAEIMLSRSVLVEFTGSSFDPVFQQLVFRFSSEHKKY